MTAVIEFRCRMRDRTMTPIARNSELRDYAEAVLADYKPGLLREPGRVDGIRFLEAYLGAEVDYQDIYYREGSSPVAGATVFRDCRIPVFDRENMRVACVAVRAGTVILDNATVSEGRESFANFTALHEGGHLCLHREAGGSICCRRADIEREGASRTRGFTPEQTREHQANVFAAYLAMPRGTFIPYARELAVREGAAADGILVRQCGDWEDEYRIERVVEGLTEVYGMSATAVRIHLRELGLIMDIHEYMERRSGTAAGP